MSAISADSTPDVSVIIGAYNVAPYIAAAIRSALDQQGITLEVIVADDASTDATLATARAIDDARVHIIAMPSNGGPSAARNAAMAQARGEWVAVLDGDDQFLPGRLARCLARARETHAQIVVDNLQRFHEADGTSAPMFAPEAFNARGTLSIADYIAENQSFLTGYTLGYLKPILSRAFLMQHQLRYAPGLRIGEDYLLMVQALACGAVCAVDPHAGYRYTVRAGSISHRISATDVQAIADADTAFVAQYPLSSQVARLNRARMRRLHEALAFSDLISALKARQPRAAWRAVWRCPAALRHLRLPLRARMERLTRRMRRPT